MELHTYITKLDTAQFEPKVELFLILTIPLAPVCALPPVPNATFGYEDKVFGRERSWPGYTQVWSGVADEFVFVFVFVFVIVFVRRQSIEQRNVLARYI